MKGEDSNLIVYDDYQEHVDWQTLWNILVNRGERQSFTHKTDLAGKSYQERGIKSRKKSCEV